MDVIGRLFGLDRGVVRRRGADEDVLVVPGITIGAAGRRAVMRFFDATPYDLFFVDYLVGAFLHRCSLPGAVAHLQAFIDEQELAAYPRLHVVASILGGWTFNLAQRVRPLPNLACAVYDRSPIQERAPAAVSGLLPASTRALFGWVVEDMAATPYPAFVHPTARMGLLIEDRASLLMRLLRGPAQRMGPISFEAVDFGQRHDDAIHLPLSHDGIYTGIRGYGPALLHVFREGRFPDDAARAASGGSVPMVGVMGVVEVRRTTGPHPCRGGRGRGFGWSGIEAQDEDVQVGSIAGEIGSDCACEN